MLPISLTLGTIDRYLAEHARLEARKLPRPVYRGELITLRMRYGMGFADVSLSVAE